MTTVVCGGSPSKTTTGDDVENFQNQDSSFSLKSDQNGMKLLLFEDSIINANNSSTSDTFKSINNNRDSKIIIANNVKTTLGDKRKIPTRQQPKTPSTIHIPRQQQRRSSDDDQVIKAKSQNQFSNESTINQTNQRNKRSSSSTTTTNKQQTQDNNFAQKRRRLRRPIWNTNSTKKSTSSLSDVSYFEQQKQQKKIVTTTTTEEEDIDNHSIRSSSPMNICQSSSNDSDSGCMSSSYGESIQSPSTTPQQSIVVKSSMESSQSINGSNDNNGDNYQPEQNVHECREQDDEPNKIFVGGLPWDTTEYDLEYYFSHFGKVTEINIKYDPMSCLTRGFCFVTFQSEETVRTILRKPVHIIKGKIIELKRAKYRPICKKVFVGGLDPLITEQDIKTYFSQYGTVIAIESPKDKIRNRKREFCFIVFDSETAVDRACYYPRQYIINRICDVKKAQPQPICYQQKRMAATAGLDQTLSTAHLNKILLSDGGKTAAVAANIATVAPDNSATSSLPPDTLNPVLTPLGTILYYQPLNSARITTTATPTSSLSPRIMPIVATRPPPQATGTTIPFVPYPATGIYSPQALYASMASSVTNGYTHNLITGAANATAVTTANQTSNPLVEPSSVADYYLNYYAQTAAYYAQQQQQQQQTINESMSRSVAPNPSTMAIISSSRSSSSSTSSTTESSSESNNILSYKSCLNTNPIIGKPSSLAAYSFAHPPRMTSSYSHHHHTFIYDTEGTTTSSNTPTNN
ncbi:rna-binding squid-like protein [Dermatophagoides farinae]|uniref:Rna-binding squid-like protein n=1 Tax=Dermatophagoides farinae TaxID=6954 RepID=A0A9D4SDM2_DERFA|nr:rna-binding squid-like protein [Dermatophagoides farinae]